MFPRVNQLLEQLQVSVLDLHMNQFDSVIWLPNEHSEPEPMMVYVYTIENMRMNARKLVFTSTDGSLDLHEVLGAALADYDSFVYPEWVQEVEDGAQAALFEAVIDQQEYVLDGLLGSHIEEFVDAARADVEHSHRI